MERKPKTIDIETKEKEYFEGGGFHRTAISKKGEGVDLTVHFSNIKPGQSHSWHSHEQDEVMYIIQGAGKYILEKGEIHYKAGDFVFVPRGTFHENVVVSEEDVVLVAIFNPAQF